MRNYYGDEVNDSANEKNDTNNHKSTTSKSFEYKAKIIGNMPNNNNTLDGESLHLP